KRLFFRAGSVELSRIDSELAQEPTPAKATNPVHSCGVAAQAPRHALLLRWQALSTNGKQRCAPAPPPSTPEPQSRNGASQRDSAGGIGSPMAAPGHSGPRP